MPLGLYISVPFCRTKCTYCNFASDVFARAVFENYIVRVCDEIASAEETAAQMGGSFERTVDSIYFGGGTPTILDVTQLERVFVLARSYSSLTSISTPALSAARQRSSRAASLPKANRLLITADAGGSNGPRLRLWKVELQRLADETGLRIAVCHFPPGTSKWNKIEHWLFSFISQNWRGKPLISFEVIVNLIAATTTAKGLKVLAEIDDGAYPPGTKIDDKELAGVRLKRANSMATGITKFIPA